MRKPIIALVMAVIAISLFINVVNAETYGWFGGVATTTHTDVADNIFYASPYTLTEDGNVTELHAFIVMYGSNNYAKFFIYSMDGQTCYYGQTTTSAVTTAGWVNLTGLGVELEAGTYLLGARIDLGGASGEFYGGTGNGMTGNLAFDAAYGALSYTFNNVGYAVYANYTVLPAGTIIVEQPINLWYNNETTFNTTMVAALRYGAPQDLMFYTLLILLFACLILMLKSSVPIINFVFGTMTLGIAAYSLQNPTIVFFGYIQMFAILMASLCMLSGYRSYRNG